MRSVPQASPETHSFRVLLVAFEWILQYRFPFKGLHTGNNDYITVGQPKQGVSQNLEFRESKVPESGLD
jgi:hypothetical protein